MCYNKKNPESQKKMFFPVQELAWRNLVEDGPRETKDLGELFDFQGSPPSASRMAHLDIPKVKQSWKKPMHE